MILLESEGVGVVDKEDICKAGQKHSLNILRVSYTHCLKVKMNGKKQNKFQFQKIYNWTSQIIPSKTDKWDYLQSPITLRCQINESTRLAFSHFFHPILLANFQSYPFIRHLFKIFSFSPHPTRFLGPSCLRNLHKISTLLVYLALLV